LLSFCCYAGKICYTEHILRSLCSSIQHVFNEDAVSGERWKRRRWQRKGGERVAVVCVQRSRTVGKAHTGYHNRRAGHLCVKYRTKFSLIFILPKLLKDILLVFYKFFSASCISYSLRFI